MTSLGTASGQEPIVNKLSNLIQRISCENALSKQAVKPCLNSAAIPQRVSGNATWILNLNSSSHLWSVLSWHSFLQVVVCVCCLVCGVFFLLLLLIHDVCWYCSAFLKEISHVLSYTMFHRKEDADCFTFGGSRGDWEVHLWEELSLGNCLVNKSSVGFPH